MSNQYILKGKNADYEVVIGLEVHCQVRSESKLFSAASASSGSNPNDTVSFIDAGFPGMLPVVNKFCVEQAVKTGLGINAKINNRSEFARKNYFYADLPQGYQISQFDKPIVGEGYLDIKLEDGTIKRIGVERLHLEQDAGKSIHDLLPSKSCIDLNRSGVALMEIVSKPDMRSPYEAGEYLTKLRKIVRTLDTCDGNMDEGSMRCDANVSVRHVGETELRTRCEIKNINSIRYMMQAIEYEAKRHIEVYDNGGTIDQETRLFNSAKKITRSMRGKENANDYRYFPCPDLAFPLLVSNEEIERIKSSMPELPDAKAERFVKEYKLTDDEAERVASDKDISEYFEEALSVKGVNLKKLVNLIAGELTAMLTDRKIEIQDTKVTAKRMGTLVARLEDDTISLRTVKDLIIKIEESDKDVDILIEELGLKQVTDNSAIELAVDKILQDNPSEVERFKAGDKKLQGFFVGQVMKATGGKVNPASINKVLADKLG